MTGDEDVEGWLEDLISPDPDTEYFKWGWNEVDGERVVLPVHTAVARFDVCSERLLGG